MNNYDKAIPLLDRSTLPSNQGTVLFDLDDTLHEAEEYVMKPAWRHLVEPFGYEWKPQGQEERMRKLGLTPITPDQEPGVGVRPLEVSRHLIRVLGLSLHTIDPERLKEFGFKRTDQLLALRNQASHSTSEEGELRFARILEAERIDFTLERMKHQGIVPLPGKEAVARLKEAGYRVGIVTSAPAPIAYRIVEKLGLITYSEPDERGVRRIKESKVDVIVSGEMAKKPKPDAAPLKMADWIIWWNTLTPEDRKTYKEELKEYRLTTVAPDRELSTSEGTLTLEGKKELLTKVQSFFPEGKKAKAYIGDSDSDVGAAKAYGIPVFIIRSEHSNEEKLRAKGPLTLVESLNEITPEMLQKPPLSGEGNAPKKP